MLFNNKSLLLKACGLRCTAVLLLGATAQAQSDARPAEPGMRDVRQGYERADDRARSVILASTDLLQVLAKPPLGLPAIPVPENNPVTTPKVQLGRKLFFDRRLSANNTLSCAMCHIAAQGFAQNELMTPVGIEGKRVRRNAPTLYNVAYLKRLFLDGREFSLENQVWGPLLAANEMGNLSIGAVIERVERLDDYGQRFQRAFGQGPDMQTVSLALASYERLLVSGNSAFDRWYFGRPASSFSVAAEHGFELFRGKAGCIACHTISQHFALFTDNRFHNTGIGFDASMRPGAKRGGVTFVPGTAEGIRRDLQQTTGTRHFGDLGRYEVSGRPADRWAYRTPTLRNIALTAPYMHDGSLPTLRDVLLFYNRGGIANQGLDEKIRPLGLHQRELDDLLRFLQSLTGSNVDELVVDALAAPIGGG